MKKHQTALNQLKKQREAIRHMFNQIAPTYDLLNHVLSLGIDTFWRRQTIKALQPIEHSLVLDLATGTGDLAQLALKKGAALVIGVDPALAMLQQGKTKFKAYPGKHVMIEGFGEFLPLRSQTFSHAMISYGIRNVSNRQATFQELYRVLQPQGLLAVLEFSQPYFRWFAKLFNFYFHYLLPRIAGWISGNRAAYEYLPRTVANFIDPKQLAKEAEAVGFTTEKIQPLFWGVTTLYLFRKT